jgi:nucleotide-binding universal stress UspA family protein
MIKDIVVNLTVGAQRDVAADYAMSMARSFGSHVAAVSFCYEMVVPGSVFGSVATSLIQAQRAESEKAAADASSRFEQAARLAGVSSEGRLFHAPLVDAVEMFGRIARRYDLSVVAQNEPDTPPGRDMIIEAALFQSGRPVVVVPYIQKEGLKLDRVMVCWDGSRNAARAVADALPILQKAKSVEVVVVLGGHGKSKELPGADIAHHLARHGLKVELSELVADDIDVPNTILSHAADVGTDFIVMGGYGHSRWREFVLGGATRAMLDSMTVPVLMSH